VIDKYTFTVQLQKLHMDMENLQEEKDTEISSTRDKLLSAQDEILLLRQAAAEAVSERDTDFVSLQEELKKVRAELEGWRKAASEYENEIRSLQSSFQLRCQQCEDQQREEATRLQGK
jgi:chromosome segregation ATPase